MIQDGAPYLANLVGISPISLWFMDVYGRYIYSDYNPCKTGGHHHCSECVGKASEIKPSLLVHVCIFIYIYIYINVIYIYNYTACCIYSYHLVLSTFPCWIGKTSLFFWGDCQWSYVATAIELVSLAISLPSTLPDHQCIVVSIVGKKKQT